MPPLTPARCSVQIGQTGSVVGKLACRPRVHLAPLANFRLQAPFELFVSGSGFEPPGAPIKWIEWGLPKRSSTISS